jgi:hypothetical protein
MALSRIQAALVEAEQQALSEQQPKQVPRLSHLTSTHTHQHRPTQQLVALQPPMQLAL